MIISQGVENLVFVMSGLAARLWQLNMGLTDPLFLVNIKRSEILFKQDLCTEHWTTMVPSHTENVHNNNGLKLMYFADHYMSIQIQNMVHKQLILLVFLV